MAKLTEEQQLQLRANKNIAYVSSSMVTFTSDFKQYAAEQLKRGKAIRAIFREQGIDPQALGAKRIENFSFTLRRLERQGQGYEDRRSIKVPKSQPSVQVEELSLAQQVEQLRHELAYTRQEVAFLKKLQMANTEARKAWESKHQPR